VPNNAAIGVRQVEITSPSGGQITEISGRGLGLNLALRGTANGSRIQGEQGVFTFAGDVRRCCHRISSGWVTGGGIELTMLPDPFRAPESAARSAGSRAAGWIVARHIARLRMSGCSERGLEVRGGSGMGLNPTPAEPPVRLPGLKA